MDDATRLGVRKAGEQPFEHARDLRQAELVHERAQRSALDVLHGDERGALVLEVVEHRDDVRMAERRDEPRLPQETLRERRVGLVKPRELLQRDVAIELGLARQVDDCHTASPDLAQQLIPSNGPQGLSVGGGRCAVERLRR